MSYSHVLMGIEYFGLALNFNVSPNSCDNPEHYENYLRFCAIEDYKNGRGVTHLFVNVDEDGNEIEIAGFVTLRATSLISESENGVPVVHPSLEIAELAVNKNHEKRGVGSALVNLALCMADELRTEKLGIKYVVLCADPKAIGFYENKHKFEKIGELYQTPREGWNESCEAMYITLPECETR